MTTPYWISWSENSNYYVVMHEQKVVTKVSSTKTLIEYLMEVCKLNGEIPEIIAVSDPSLEKMVKETLRQTPTH